MLSTAASKVVANLSSSASLSPTFRQPSTCMVHRCANRGGDDL
jgi:hypothetical protein